MDFLIQIKKYEKGWQRLRRAIYQPILAVAFV